MKAKHVLIWSGVVIGGAVLLHYIIKKKNSIGNTGPSGQVPVSPTVPKTPPLGASNGNQVYTTQSDALIRSSPCVRTGFFGFGSNSVAVVQDVGGWMGTWQGSTAADTDGTINPSTRQPYNWYQITPAPTVMDTPSSGPYYVREDYITIK